MQKTDTAELRRLHEAATKGEWIVEPVDAIGRAVLRRGARRMFPIPANDAAFIAAAHNALPALLDELEAASLEMRRQGSVIAELREEVRRLTQANGDIRKERDRAVAEAQRQDGVAKGLRAAKLRQEVEDGN